MNVLVFNLFICFMYISIFTLMQENKLILTNYLKSWWKGLKPSFLPLWADSLGCLKWLCSTWCSLMNGVSAVTNWWHFATDWTKQIKLCAKLGGGPRSIDFNTVWSCHGRYCTMILLLTLHYNHNSWPLGKESISEAACCRGCRPEKYVHIPTEKVTGFRRKLKQCIKYRRFTGTTLKKGEFNWNYLIV